jgi:hypothetical protein
MSYEATYLEARKKYWTEADKLKAGRTLKSVVEEPSIVALVKKMDGASGSPDAMKTALQAYSDSYNKYLEKIAAQTKKEQVDQGKMKALLDAYGKALRTLFFNYQQDHMKQVAARKAMADRQAEAKSELKAAAAAVANSAATAAAQRNLKLALEDFKKRRNEHLTAITAMYQEARVASSDLTKLSTKASQSVDMALNLAKVGKLIDAKKVADEAAIAAKSVDEVASKLAADYQKKITDKFTKDRELGFGHYEKQGLLESQEAEFKKGQVEAKGIFDKAVALGMETLNLIRKFEAMAKQSGQAAEEARKAASVQEVAPDILKGLLSAQEEVMELAKLLTESLSEGTGLSVLTNGKAALERKSAAEAVLRKSAIEKEVSKLKGFVDQARAIANAQTTKVPPELKTKDLYKTALTKMSTSLLEATRSFNAFSKQATELATQLGAVK